MSRVASPALIRCGSTAVTLLALALATLPAWAQPGEGRVADRAGRVDFDFPDAPAAKVQVDLKEGMLSAFAGVGQAAIQGVAEALIESSHGDAESAARVSAQHLQAVHEIFEAISQVVREVRVRVYEHVAEQTNNNGNSVVEHYEKKLDATNWDRIVRVREENSTLLVCALQSDQAIHGLFVMLSEGDGLVLANVVCELTPEKVKQVTNQATKIGMQVGLEEFIERGVEKLDQRRR